MKAERKSLAGAWTCALDPQDGGREGRWWLSPLAGPAVVLPGTLAAQGLGEAPSLATAWTGTIIDRSFFDDSRYAEHRKPGHLRIPFWLQPERVYVGPAWFQHQVEVAPEWAGGALHLMLERPHGHCEVWWDDRSAGVCDSLSVPHRFVLTMRATPGRHRLTVRIDNRLTVDVGENAHSVSDHTQGNWNGLVGRIELIRTEPVWIDDLQVYPDLAAGTVRVRARLAGALPSAVRATLRIVSMRDEAPPARWAIESEVGPDGTFESTVHHGAEATRWDEFSPSVYRARLTLENGEMRAVSFGFRDVRADGRAIKLNGRRIFLRGTLDCCAYPGTGHPPMELPDWRTILGNLKDHGLNHVRFHSWCPPRAAFDAADELGMYLQVEASTWCNHDAVAGAQSPGGLGDGSPVDGWLLREGEAILREYGNHPSFILFAAGNEPGGPHHRDYLARWVRAMKTLDSRRLHTGTSGWPELEGNDFHVVPEPRLHQWDEGLRSRLNSVPPATDHDYAGSIARRDRPVISHEIGQWCAYPPVYDTAKYHGYLKARNYEIFRQTLEAHGLGGQVRDFVQASGRLQALCYREEIEASLRTADQAGFQLLGLLDFPGQGTATVGMLDVFGDSKGYLSAEEMRRHCAPTVPLVRLPSRVFTYAQPLSAVVELAHYGPEAYPDARLRWELRSASGTVVRQGELPGKRVETAALTRLGTIELSWAGLTGPARYDLVVLLADTPVWNRWDVWLFPERPSAASQPGVEETGDVSAALQSLARGGTVLLELNPADLAGDVVFGFSPIFWNTAWTKRQAPHTLGLLCRPEHPALAAFPSEQHTNWQWWQVVHRAGALVLDGFPRALTPIVQVIDDWFTNRRLGLVFEARLGAGRVLVCGAPLAGQSDPVVQQLRASLLQYAASEAFRPSVEVTEAQLRSLVKP